MAKTKNMSMMEFPINLPDVETNKLKLVVPKLVGKTKVMYNDHEVQKLNNRYSVTNKSDKPIIITLKNNYFDLVPKVFVNNIPTPVVQPLKWYVYIWMGLPILLAFQGGLIGALLGFFAIRLNSGIFRSNNSQLIKYLMTLGINILIASVYITIVTILNGIIKK